MTREDLEWTYAEAFVDDGKGDVDVYEKKDVDELLNALEARIKELEGVVSKLENTQKWISVDDVKPQWGVLVKIKFKDGSEDERRFSYDYKWVSKGMKTCESVNVTHWMPLPPCHTTSRHVTTTEESSVIEKEG